MPPLYLLHFDQNNRGSRLQIGIEKNGKKTICLVSFYHNKPRISIINLKLNISFRGISNAIFPLTSTQREINTRLNNPCHSNSNDASNLRLQAVIVSLNINRWWRAIGRKSIKEIWNILKLLFRCWMLAGKILINLI